jgi:hypothetical protein
MAVTKTITEAMFQAMRTKKAFTANITPGDLRAAYFGGKLSQSDEVRNWLRTQTGITANIATNDLWRNFFISKAIVNRVSLTDMAVEYFATATLP